MNQQLPKQRANLSLAVFRKEIWNLWHFLLP
uniref:Uncharacterized protein n=1 Tax=Podoviridae sp. ctKmJ5 TaxID=2827732 RepID=A0A8S5SZN6_9CAUD|nr:MAG TPA: hypothetical protein [Podoviridae sp. ctKmJ5]